ncbi:MAG: four helix bundle protein [Proteobacteria bacterium]|nr:four helix bundle protein [Pseudomonadota bacterium]MBU4294650.1 four helix bundle protein [Pseudomonadota bacterium]MCG2748883.1 four helix bundle protein [Desulfobulbaceae bacterium]
MGNNLKERSKKFALDVIGLVDGLLAGRTAAVIGKQLLRSGMSVGANYRAACRAKSPADFIAKMGIVEEEADECIYWMELLAEANILPLTRLQPLMAEADELVAITVSSIKTAKANKMRSAK